MLSPQFTASTAIITLFCSAGLSPRGNSLLVRNSTSLGKAYSFIHQTSSSPSSEKDTTLLELQTPIKAPSLIGEITSFNKEILSSFKSLMLPTVHHKILLSFPEIVNKPS
jgi:hypothetical protein